MATKSYVIRKKTSVEPLVMEFKVTEDNPKKPGEEIVKTLTFQCKPTLSGDQMLDISAIQEQSYSAGIRAMFDAALEDDQKDAWSDFLKSPNGPDLDEINDINNDLVSRYSNRQSENPTQTTD